MGSIRKHLFGGWKFFQTSGAGTEEDPYNPRMNSLDYPHWEIHEGNHYFYENVAALGSAEVKLLEITVPDSLKWPHFLFSVSSDLKATIELFEGVSNGTGGSTLTPVNNNRNSSNTSGLVIKTGASVATDVAAQGTLTVDTQPTVGDTMTIGASVYTFTTDGTAAAEGEIDVGEDLADAKTLIVAAINGTDGNNTANASVTAAAFSSDDCVLTAAATGEAGNLIVTTETFTAETNVFDAGTLGTTTAGTSAGVSIMKRQSGTGTNPSQAFPGEAERESEIILKQDTTYLLKITSGAAGNNVDYRLSWYEHTGK